MHPDFAHLYFICREGLVLRNNLAAFRQRFASARPDVTHRVMALTYFEDAEQEPEPLLLRPAKWAEIRTFFEQEVRALWSEGL
jgi:hypothetical protein